MEENWCFIHVFHCFARRERPPIFSFSFYFKSETLAADVKNWSFFSVSLTHTLKRGASWWLFSLTAGDNLPTAVQRTAFLILLSKTVLCLLFCAHSALAHLILVLIRTMLLCMNNWACNILFSRCSYSYSRAESLEDESGYI